MRLVLFQPDIPQNVGAAIRLTACFGVPLDIVEPCAFPMTDRTLKRAALDYGERADVVRHNSWSAFVASDVAQSGRLVLVETDGAEALPDFRFTGDDCLVMGRESAGVTPEVVAACSTSVRVPLVPGVRSLNVHTAAAIVLAQGLLQTGALSALATHR